VAVDRQEEEEVGWGHHDTLVAKWATVEREEKEAAAAAEMHAMSYPVVVVRHNMLEGIRAQRLAEGAVPMAVCYLCAGEIFQGEFDSVACVSDNSKIHLKCAMVSFAADPNLLNLSCQCGDTEKVDGNGARPVCGGFSGALVDKAAREARVRGQEEALAHEAKLNALVEARTALDPARYDSLPMREEEVLAVTIIGLESETGQNAEEREQDWLKWFKARTSADQVLFKVKIIDTQGQASQGQACTLHVTWPAAATPSEAEQHLREIEGLVMSLAPQSAHYGNTRVPARGPVMRSQDGERMRNMPLLIQLVVESSQFPPTFRRTKIVEGIRYKIKPIPAGAMRGLAKRIDSAALPSFTQELGNPAFDTAGAMLKVKRSSFQAEPEHNHGKRPADGEGIAYDHYRRSPSYDRGSSNGGEGRPRYSGGRLKGRVYLQYLRYLPFLPADETLSYINAENDFWYPNNGAGLKDSVEATTTTPDAPGITSKPISQGDTRYDCPSLERRYMVGHDYRKCPLSVTGESVVRAYEVDTTWPGGGDEKKCSETSTDTKELLKGVLTGSGGGTRSARLGTEEEKRCNMGRDVTELMEGGPSGGHGGMSSELLATKEEKHCVGSRLVTARASEDLPTVVKTNLPTLWAVGKRLVIPFLILLHFCGGAQALNLPIRGLPRGGRTPDSLPGNCTVTQLSSQGVRCFSSALGHHREPCGRTAKGRIHPHSLELWEGLSCIHGCAGYMLV
jgi:hypothetical protein